MTWRIMLQDNAGQKYTSSALDTREQTLSFAADLLQAGDLQILKIEDEHGETIDLDEVPLSSAASTSTKR